MIFKKINLRLKKLFNGKLRTLNEMLGVNEEENKY